MSDYTHVDKATGEKKIIDSNYQLLWRVTLNYLLAIFVTVRDS